VKFHRLRIRLHFTKSIRNKQVDWRGYLALKDRRIKSNFSWSNRSIEEVGQSVERKNPKRKRKKMRMAQRGRVRVVKGWGLGAKIYGVKAWRQWGWRQGDWRQYPFHISATPAGSWHQWEWRYDLISWCR
jgi:hypothetical protein